MGNFEFCFQPTNQPTIALDLYHVTAPNLSQTSPSLRQKWMQTSTSLPTVRLALLARGATIMDLHSDKNIKMYSLTFQILAVGTRTFRFNIQKPTQVFTQDVCRRVDPGCHEV